MSDMSGNDEGVHSSGELHAIDGGRTEGAKMPRARRSTRRIPLDTQRLVDQLIAANRSNRQIVEMAGVSSGYVSNRKKALEAAVRAEGLEPYRARRDVERAGAARTGRPVAPAMSEQARNRRQREIARTPQEVRAELIRVLAEDALAESGLRSGLPAEDMRSRLDLSRSIGTLIKGISDLEELEMRKRAAESDMRSASEVDDWLGAMTGTGGE
jgi:hypothetical protein